MALLDAPYLRVKRNLARLRGRIPRQSAIAAGS